MDTQDVLDAARERAIARIAATPRIDYEGVNRHHPKQRAALTRAKNSGDPEKIKAAVVKAVREWRAAPYNGFWPDDWAKWQSALDDAMDWNRRIDIADIR